MPDAVRSSDITLAILAGGEGSRMGQPKGLLRIAGIPILAHLLDRLAWDGATMLVTAPGREQPPGCERFTREVADPIAGQGPLRGILTALENTTTDITLIATVDMPAITHDMLLWLASQLAQRPDTHALLLRRPADASTDIEPFPSAYRRSAAQLVNHQLTTGRRAVHRLADHPTVALLDAPTTWPDAAWINLNNPDDLKAYEHYHWQLAT